ncbi:MAG: sigma-70 family RNA polymerase sigma factor [Phycisphaerales bacterium]|nr:MAG: sigma-70 family RNA polymerase sigma factor [Phycisphaerales bacterium]
MENRPKPDEAHPSQGQVTCLIRDIQQGDANAASSLLTVVYDELRRLAAARIAGERPGQTLQATALVHEAYLRLIGNSDPGWRNRGHFFAAAAEAMRRILVEQARRKSSVRGGGGRKRHELHDSAIAVEDDSIDLIALSEALDRLTAEAPRKSELVKLRYFTGLTNAEAAAAMGISRATAERYWAYSRLRLYQWMNGPDARWENK